MIADKILVTIVGIAGIVFTYWFFLERKEDKKRSKQLSGRGDFGRF